MPSPGKTFWDIKVWGRLELLVLQICITFLVFTYNHKYTKFVFHFLTSLFKKRASQVALAVKYLPATETQEMWAWSLDWEDPLEESTATHSSVLAWRTPWTEEPCRLQSKESQPKWLSTKHAQCIKKQRHHFTNKDLRSESYGFSSSHVWMWELDCKEGWVLKNWYFWFVVLEKTLESPLDCKEIKSVNPEYSLEGLMLKLQYFGHLMWRADLLKKTLMMGKIKSKRRGRQRMRYLDGITDTTAWVWANSGRWWRTGRAGVLQSMRSQRFGHDLVSEQRRTHKI